MEALNSKKNKRRDFTGTAFIAPAFTLFTFFVVIPLVMSIYYGFTKWNGISKPQFTGLENYLKLIQNADYWKTFSNTMILLIVSLVFQVILGLVLAWLLCNSFRFFKVYRAVIFLPVVVAPMAIGLLFSLFYNPEFGLIDPLLSFFIPGFTPPEWLSDPSIVLISVIIPQVWQYIGMYMVIFSAAILSIPDDIFESSHIDGANQWIVFSRIVIPQVKGIFRICIVLAVTGSLKAFDHAWAITGGGPGFQSSYLAIYMYKSAFVRGSYGYASAVSVTMLLVSLLLTFIVRKLIPSDEGVA